MITLENLRIDGKIPGDVLEFQITCTEETKMCTVKFNYCGEERIYSLPLSAISFEVAQ